MQGTYTHVIGRKLYSRHIVAFVIVTLEKDIDIYA